MSSIIQQKSRDFAIRIINCYNYLVGEKHEQVMSKGNADMDNELEEFAK